VRFLRKLASKEKESAGSADHVVFLDATDVVLTPKPYTINPKPYTLPPNL